MNRHIVSRKKLFDKLDRIRDCKLTLLTAPAGYGKTTAVLDWAQQCGLTVVWLPVNEYNNTPKAFWKDVCAVLSVIAPDLEKESEYIISSAELLGAQMHINLILDKLSKISADFVLVLDDLHLITDTSILSALSYLVNYLPEKMHLIIISRTMPELSLSRFSVKWQMQKIGVSDLQFQKEDILRFFEARGISLHNDDIELLESYTEGWAASLVTIALSLEKEEITDIASLPELDRDIGQYLKDEVIIGWSEEKKTFALETSVLDILSEDLCGAVTGNPYAGRILSELYEDNGFLFALDREKKTYRFHHLFKDFLFKLLPETHPASAANPADATDVAALQKKAGVWYREHGDTEKAVEFFLKGSAYTEVMSILEHNVVVYGYDIKTLFNWLEQVPLPLKENSFKAAYIYATYYADTDRLDAARLWSGKMKEIAAQPFNHSCLRRIDFCRIACIFQETTLMIREGNADFLSYFVSAIEPHRAKFFEFPSYFNFNTGDIFFYRCPIGILTLVFGENKEQYETLTESFWKIVPFIQKPGYMLLLPGEYYYENDCPDEALPYLLEAMEAASQTGCPGVLVPAMADIARVKRAKGDYDGAFATLDECEKRLKPIGEPHWKYLIAAFRCRLSIDIGDVESVERWFSSCKLDVFSELSKIREYELLVYARTLLFFDRLQDAETLLNRILIFCEKVNRFHSEVEALNLLAILEYKVHRPQKALRSLDRSLSIGMERNFIRSYLDESEPMDKLLALYTKHFTALSYKKNADYAALLLERMKSSGSTSVINLTESLTDREREVLSLLIEAYTNQEISDRLCITLQTVKNHIGNIYGKLGVKNRVQCQKLAGELNL